MRRVVERRLLHFIIILLENGKEVRLSSEILLIHSLDDGVDDVHVVLHFIAVQSKLVELGLFCNASNLLRQNVLPDSLLVLGLFSLLC